MKITGIATAIAVFCIVSVCCRNTGGKMAFVEALNLTPRELVSLQRSAVGGDAVSASRLADYYSMYLMDEPSGFSWLELAAVHGGQIEKENVRVMIEVLELSPEEVSKLSPKAKAGDVSAAVQLVEHYWCVRKDYSESLVWMKLAAQYGGYLDKERYRRGVEAIQKMRESGGGSDKAVD